MKTVRLTAFFLAAVITFITTGCATPSIPPTAVAQAPAPAASATPRTAPAPTSIPQKSLPNAAAPSTPALAERVVKHAMGETKAPAIPQRVVVLDTGELDIALTLGLVPVGAVAYTLDQEFPSQLRDRTAGIKRVGTVAQPNLEAIAALKPDLILSSKLRHEAVYGKLAQIAPTVFSENLGVAWKDALKVHAAALGKTKEGDEFMSSYYKRLEELKQKMGPRLAQTKVSFIRSFPDHIRIYMNRSFSGTILKDAGLPRPTVQDQDKVYDQVNEERIPDMDGDVIFAGYYERAKGETLSKMTKHPLWSQLKAVKDGKVYEVNDDVWGVGLGPTAANLMVDDLFKYLIR